MARFYDGKRIIKKVDTNTYLLETGETVSGDQANAVIQAANTETLVGGGATERLVASADGVMVPQSQIEGETLTRNESGPVKPNLEGTILDARELDVEKNEVNTLSDNELARDPEVRAETIKKGGAADEPSETASPRQAKTDDDGNPTGGSEPLSQDNQDGLKVGEEKGTSSEDQAKAAEKAKSNSSKPSTGSKTNSASTNNEKKVQ